MKWFYFCAISLLLFGCGKEEKRQLTLCEQTYALCTSAKCVPMPGDPSRAICTCTVEEGKSMATVPCEKLKPTVDENKIRTIYSTFNFKQYREGKKIMQCPGGTPWTDCLNKTCTVDPDNPTKAICTCDVIRSSEDWVTFGGGCETATCGKAYFSGAPVKASEEANAFMTKELGLPEVPVKLCRPKRK